jgi:hypothetical protein
MALLVFELFAPENPGSEQKRLSGCRRLKKVGPEAAAALQQYTPQAPDPQSSRSNLELLYSAAERKMPVAGVHDIEAKLTEVDDHKTSLEHVPQAGLPFFQVTGPWLPRRDLRRDSEAARGR